MFWLVLGGASLAQVATNASNDYFDHTSNADEINKFLVLSMEEVE